jgi:hypothetical protein
MASAMVNYGPAQYRLSRKLNEKLLVLQTPNAASFYRFRFRGIRPSGSKFFNCVGCEKLGKDRTLTVTEENGQEYVVALKSPFVDHHANCAPLPETDFELLMLKRGVFVDARKGQATARTLYDQAGSSLHQKYRDREHVYEALIPKFPTFQSVRSSLNHHRSANKVVIPDPRVIPDEFRYTKRGREMPASSQYHHER